jgi:hypothetical protein
VCIFLSEGNIDNSWSFRGFLFLFVLIESLIVGWIDMDMDIDIDIAEFIFRFRVLGYGDADIIGGGVRRWRLVY